MSYFKPTEEETADAAVKLTEAFGGMRDFPNNENGLMMYARGFRRIVWGLQTSEIPSLHGTPHPKIGDMRDDDWLIEQALERFSRFPALIDLRKLYEQSLPPRDGRSSSDMA